MKPTIDEQIEAVEYAHVILKPVPGISSDSLDRLVAAVATLKWVKHKHNGEERMSEGLFIGAPGTVLTLSNAENPWARISEIAARVGVKPHVQGATITATGSDGNAYDVFEVVAAVLDRIEASTRQQG
jgi:hypothetical protein